MKMKRATWSPAGWIAVVVSLLDKVATVLRGLKMKIAGVGIWEQEENLACWSGNLHRLHCPLVGHLYEFHWQLNVVLA